MGIPMSPQKNGRLFTARLKEGLPDWQQAICATFISPEDLVFKTKGGSTGASTITRPNHEPAKAIVVKVVSVEFGVELETARRMLQPEGICDDMLFAINRRILSPERLVELAKCLFGVTLTVTWHDYSEVPNNCWFGASYIGHEFMVPGCYGWPSHAIRYKRTRSAVRQTVNLSFSLHTRVSGWK